MSDERDINDQTLHAAKKFPYHASRVDSCRYSANLDLRNNDDCIGDNSQRLIVLGGGNDDETLMHELTVTNASKSNKNHY